MEGIPRHSPGSEKNPKKEGIRSYIIGGGMSGLTCSFYTGLEVIGKNIGGQIVRKLKWDLGPRFIHADPYTEKFLTDLGFPLSKKTVSVGYNRNGVCTKDTDFDSAYYHKSRKTKRTPIKTASSQGKTSFEAFEIDMHEIMHALNQRVASEIIPVDVVRIDLDKKELELEGGKILPYDKLVSTVPAPVFAKLANVKIPKLHYLRKTFILTEEQNVKDFDKQYDYVYYAGDEPYHRVSQCDIEGYVVCEFVGDDYKKSQMPFKEMIDIEHGQIQNSGVLDLDLPDVTFLGRYAEWQHGILTNDIVRRCQTMNFSNDIKVCAVDLDGVLCEYPKAWVEFANKYLGTNYNFYELKDNVSFNKYKQIKAEYRKSGIKANLPAMHGAKALIDGLKARGYIVIVLSARPVFEHKEVMRDTLTWFKKNGISPDMFFWGKDKHVKIIKYFPNLDFMIEDDTKAANNIAEHGYQVYLLDNEYNQQPIDSGVTRVKMLSEVLEFED